MSEYIYHMIGAHIILLWVVGRGALPGFTSQGSRECGPITDENRSVTFQCFEYWCRYQIHTGLQHGVIWPAQPNGLPLKHPTIADKLRAAGYKTSAIGKWVRISRIRIRGV